VTCALLVKFDELQVELAHCKDENSIPETENQPFCSSFSSVY